MKVAFIKSLLKVTNMSLIDAGISSFLSSLSSCFIPRFLFSAAILFLRAARGNSLGNIIIMNANAKREIARVNHPSHHAPNHRGSLLSIVGVRSGEM